MPRGTIRIGTCSWTDKSLSENGSFYPRGAGTPKARLKYYARRFDTVEIDSSYYQIPTREMACAWAGRTPEKFLFHLKAFGALTGHNIAPSRLPENLKAMLPPEDLAKEEVHVSAPEPLKAMAHTMMEALEPLKAAGKLGFIIFQFPPWFGCSKANREYLLYCKELIPGHPIAVEFRHGSWLAQSHRQETFATLRDHKITYITCDEPQLGNMTTVPFHPEATTSVAYLRLHGRNTEIWLSRSTSPDEYCYKEEELIEIAAVATRLSARARLTFVLFNNCRCGCAAKNAARLRAICGGR